ncbi:unnamed protein product [Enterobius vermicularis]|uniref:Secreted mucin n=1 Tax=Enterobius vermicularis TaxID=51028 RepID=A0A0N4V6X5_ENTVE|nr:unnamed protein product [Enterobius vermicularis]
MKEECFSDQSFLFSYIAISLADSYGNISVRKITSSLRISYRCLRLKISVAFIVVFDKGSSTVSVATSTGSQSSPQSQLVSPALSVGSSSTHSFKQKKVSTTYDPSDERAVPPLLSPGSLVNTDMTNTACITVIGGNCSTSSSAARSYAEIAKSKSPVMASSCASDAPSHSSARDTSPELCTASTSTNNDDRCTSVTSSAGGSVEIIDKDGSGNNGGGNKVDGESAKSSAVDGFSFFYDPNEPTSICDAPSLTAEGNEASCEFFSPSTPTAVKVGEAPAKSVILENKPERNGEKSAKFGTQEKNSEKITFKYDSAESKPKEVASSIVLKFEGGRTLVLPSMNVGGSFEVDRKKKEMMNSAWKSFMENGPAPIRYTPGVLQGVSVLSDGDH